MAQKSVPKSVPKVTPREGIGIYGAALNFIAER